MLRRALIVLPAAAVPLLCYAALASGSVRLHGGASFHAEASVPRDYLGDFHLNVAPDSRRVTVTSSFLAVPCTGGPQKGEEIGLDVSGGHARVGAGGTLRVTLRTDDGGRAPMILTGRFVSSKKFIGTMSFSGGTEDPHCDAKFRVAAWMSNRFRTYLWVGRTAAGNRLKFYRTVGARPKVLGLHVVVTGKCPGGFTRPKGISMYRGITTPVKHGAFRQVGEDLNTEDVTFTGRFLSSTTATGRLQFEGRDDCGVDLRWRAKRVGPGPITTQATH